MPYDDVVLTRRCEGKGSRRSRISTESTILVSIDHQFTINVDHHAVVAIPGKRVRPRCCDVDLPDKVCRNLIRIQTRSNRCTGPIGGVGVGVRRIREIQFRNHDISHGGHHAEAMHRLQHEFLSGLWSLHHPGGLCRDLNVVSDPGELIVKVNKGRKEPTVISSACIQSDATFKTRGIRRCDNQFTMGIDIRVVADQTIGGSRHHRSTFRHGVTVRICRHRIVETIDLNSHRGRVLANRRTITPVVVHRVGKGIGGTLIDAQSVERPVRIIGETPVCEHRQPGSTRQCDR